MGFPWAFSQTIWVSPRLPAKPSGFSKGLPPIGAKTFTGELGDRKAKQTRVIGGAQNRIKCPELGLELFDYFIHNVEVLRSRADSVLLMSKARSIREVMIRTGVPEGDIPKLEGAAGKAWFRRWRRRFTIVKHAKVFHLKVSWKKIKARTKVLWTIYFRLRFIWKKCFPNKKLRFFSLDQKPAHFNNVALLGTYTRKGKRATVKEIFAHSRTRYTICTSVQNWAPSQGKPHVGVLFKGKKKATSFQI